MLPAGTDIGHLFGAGRAGHDDRYAFETEARPRNEAGGQLGDPPLATAGKVRNESANAAPINQRNQRNQRPPERASYWN